MHCHVHVCVVSLHAFVVFVLRYKSARGLVVAYRGLFCHAHVCLHALVVLFYHMYMYACGLS